MDSIGTRSIAKIQYLNATGNSSELELEEETEQIKNNTYVNAAFEFDFNDHFSRKETSSTCHGDDVLVYANLSEISKRKELEDIDRQPYPPYPDAATEPLRIIANGWHEYRTVGGRSYYFHPENGICQWKPPRSSTTYKLQYGENNSVNITSGSFTATSIPRESDFSCEIPLHYQNEKRKIVANSSRNSDLNKSVNIETTENLCAHKNIMSHSLDVGNNHNKCCATLSESRQTEKINTLYDIPANVSTHRDTAVRHGILEKCKIAENGVKIKRSEWCNTYAYLYTGHLLFYKDQKSAEKMGKHYPTPTDVCDLRNALASCSEAEKQRDKKHKHVITLILPYKTEYRLSCSEEEINDWFNALKQAITTTPAPKIPSHTIISDYNGSLQRSLRHKRDSGSSFSGKSTFHNSIKSRLKPSSCKSISENHFSPLNEDNNVESNHPTRATIIERLLRFFRSRPSMESLRERGIYKPEPVFGSTLSEICAHDKTLVPKFITEVTSLIEQKGIDSDGLYRVNGNLSSVQKIRCQIDQDCYELMRREEDIHVLSGALKLFLRELQEPIFPTSLHKDFMSAMRESGSKRLRCIDELLINLPTINKETLRVLICHLNKVAVHSGKNRMQVHNLAIIFGPSLFCSEERSGHLRRPSQDKGKGSGCKRKSLDKRLQEEIINNQPSGPTQNLAYRMIVYGQILEYILTETERLSIFKIP